jgi:hypothetical protein
MGSQPAGTKKSKIKPKRNDEPTIVAKYANVVFLPNVFSSTVMVATFVAGPAIRKIKAAPGDNPFNISTAAMGTDDVAQMYNGIEANITNRYVTKTFPCRVSK